MPETIKVHIVPSGTPEERERALRSAIQFLLSKVLGRTDNSSEEGGQDPEKTDIDLV